MPPLPHPSPNIFPLVFGRRAIVGSLIGGIAETQEMLDFCAEKGITAEIETISIMNIEKAYERMLKSDIKYRFVIDIPTPIVAAVFSILVPDVRRHVNREEVITAASKFPRPTTRPLLSRVWSVLGS